MYQTRGYPVDQELARINDRRYRKHRPRALLRSLSRNGRQLVESMARGNRTES